MTYINDKFPARVALGAVSTSDWMVAIVTNQGGFENRNLYSTRAKHHYDCALAVRTESDFKAVRDHWHRMRGRTHSFPFTDPVDHKVAENEGVLVALPGAGQFQLYKLYGDYLRKITRPFAVEVQSGGFPILPTMADGVATLAATGSRSISSHTVGVAHKFTLASALSGAVVGSYVSAAGVSGSAAGILTGKNLQVTAVSGADVTVAVSTDGMTATGGTLSVYPGDLAWSGGFYTPCRYDMVGLPAGAVNRNGGKGELLIEVSQLTLIEVYE